MNNYLFMSHRSFKTNFSKVIFNPFSGLCTVLYSVFPFSSDFCAFASSNLKSSCGFVAYNLIYLLHVSVFPCFFSFCLTFYWALEQPGHKAKAKHVLSFMQLIKHWKTLSGCSVPSLCVCLCVQPSLTEIKLTVFLHWHQNAIFWPI